MEPVSTGFNSSHSSYELAVGTKSSEGRARTQGQLDPAILHYCNIVLSHFKKKGCCKKQKQKTILNQVVFQISHCDSFYVCAHM